MASSYRFDTSYFDVLSLSIPAVPNQEARMTRPRSLDHRRAFRAPAFVFRWEPGAGEPLELGGRGGPDHRRVERVFDSREMEGGRQARVRRTRKKLDLPYRGAHPGVDGAAEGACGSFFPGVSPKQLGMLPVMRLRVLVPMLALPLTIGSLPTSALSAPSDCFGQRPTISGGGGANVIEGTPGADVIDGRGGDDVILGLGGNDAICGGSGADKISGGPGDDRLDGGAGATEDDTVTYRQSSSGVVVDLEAGRATGEGNDTLRGFEVVIGSPGSDSITGDPTAEYEELRSKGGDDALLAKAKISMLFGGSGNDALHGGSGEDDFFPGPGDDTIDARGAGIDTLVFWSSPRAVTVDVAAGVATGEGNDRFIGVDHVFGSHHGDELLGSDGADLLNGDVGDDVIRGRGGNDRLYGDTNNDRIFGGPGDDRLDGQWQHDALDGGPGTDTCLNGEELTACE